MSLTTISLALAAGMLSTLSPCVLPLLPVVLTRPPLSTGWRLLRLPLASVCRSPRSACSNSFQWPGWCS
jgi:hypothetical protein